MYDGDPAAPGDGRALRLGEARAGAAPARLERRGAGEPANDAILRGDLIATLGGLGDPAVVAEANRRFAANDPSVTAGPLRETILGIVALNADAATWDRLRAMARDERNPLVKVQLYRLLGGARDPALAQRALELALTDEPGATNASQIISRGRRGPSRPRLRFRARASRAGRGAGRRLVAARASCPASPRARPIRRWSTSCANMPSAT